MLNGASFPVYSIIFSDMLADMLTLTGTALSDAATKWALIFLAFVRGEAQKGKEKIGEAHEKARDKRNLG